MSASFSIEISGDENPKSQSWSSSSIVERFDVSPSRSSSSVQQKHLSQDRTTGAVASGDYEPPAIPAAAAQRVMSQDSRRGNISGSSQQLQQTRQYQDNHGVESWHSDDGDGSSSVPPSAEGGPSLQREGSASSTRGIHQRQVTMQNNWGHPLSSRSHSGSHSQLDVPRPPLSIPSTPVAAPSSLKAVSAVGPPRVASLHPSEGILKRRTDKSSQRSMSGDHGAVSPRNKLWVAPGSVLWRLFCFALAARVGSSLALLIVVLTTLGRMGKAVTCVDMSNCVGGGGILAFPLLFRTLPNFGAGVVAYETITESLVAGLVLVLLPIVGNCYYTCQALVKGTKKAYLEEVRMTTCCTAWVGACLGAFIPPAFITEQFCDASHFDVNLAYRTEVASIAAASRNMCNQRYARLWGTLLALGCTKFMLSGFVLCSTIMIGEQGNEMMLEAMDGNNGCAGDERLQKSMVTQLGLFLALVKWGGFILAVSNLACGAFTMWAAHLRSHLMSCANLVTNFVFFFINAVAFCAMLFEDATLRLVCNYEDYPMNQSQRALEEAAYFCTIRPQFLFLWLLVALLALIHLTEFIISAILFQREFCSSTPKAAPLVSAPSIDSLPPKWGIVR
ncbi:hypothetical protein Efla_005230 [Eimeria flavescens]